MTAISGNWPPWPAVTLVLVGALLPLWASPARSQEPIEDIGKREFMRSCAVCHGDNGKGDGLMTGLLLVNPPDLTAIAKRRGGKFPAEWVYRIIDGRNEIRPHGSEEMPIWGDRYRADALRGLPLPLNVSADAVVHGRILSLVYYLELIQED